MEDNNTFKRVKSLVFGKNDEEFFNELNKAGYFNKNWNNKIKELIRADFYGSKEKSETFTKEQENAILSIIKRHVKELKVESAEETFSEIVVDKETIDKSKEAIQALSNLQKFRKK